MLEIVSNPEKVKFKRELKEKTFEAFKKAINDVKTVDDTKDLFTYYKNYLKDVDIIFDEDDIDYAEKVRISLAFCTYFSDWMLNLLQAYEILDDF